MKRVFFIIGAPGSGKTTDAQLIAQRHRELVVHFSTGDLLRDEVKRGSRLGEEIANYINRGELVPLSIVIETIREAIERADRQIVLIDGFPRSEEQMLAFEKMVSENSEIVLERVIEVVVSEKTARERVLGRARGADDNEQVFQNRMKVFRAPLETIEQFYSRQGKLIKIDGERTVEEIVADIETHLPF